MMYKELVTALVLFKSVTDCVFWLRKGRTDNAIICGFVHVLLLILLTAGGFYE